MTHSAWLDDHLELLPIDADAWRMCDRRMRASDAEFVVAYIERVDEGFDVVWMRGPRRRSRLRTLEECLRRGSELLSQERSRSRRPVPIPHFPPVRTS